MTAQAEVFSLSDNSHIGEVRRAATRCGQLAGLAEVDYARLAIVATELASNVIRHAGGGEIIVRGCSGDKAVELIALDRGPGMADPARCMSDGLSSAGSLGHGLGAVARLSAGIDIYSMPGRGSAIYARVEPASHGTTPCTRDLSWYGISVPAPGESECGDDYQVAKSTGQVAAVIADGLGHGPLAARAANRAIRIFDQAPFLAPGAYLTAAHEALSATRGAAAACAYVELGRGTMFYAGVGNISAGIVGHQTLTLKSLASNNGTVGLQIGKVRQFEYPALTGDLLVMHSDGLSARWKPADYPGLWRRDPALIAAILYRDLKRGRDDATVVVVRLE